MSVDKTAVREDYINGLTVRALAAKYDVPKSTIGRWVKQYGWVREAAKIEKTLPKKRDKARDMSSTGTSDGTRHEAAVQAWTSDWEKLRDYTMKLLDKPDQLLELDDALAPRDLKSLSSMLLDVRTLLNTLSPREAEEQEMRLAALRKQAQEEQKTSAEVTVRFVDTEGAEV